MMNKYLIPDILRAEDSDILTALKNVSTAQNLTAQDAEEIFDLLPTSLKKALAFKDKMTGIWRYEYGIPYSIDSDQILFGTDQAPKVSVLFNGLRALQKHVKQDDFLSFCKKIENPDKHLDILSELDPIMRPNINFKAYYEPIGYASGNKKIDWLIKFDDESSYLIDVKNRIKGLLNLADQIAQNDKNNFKNSAPSPNGIFKSSETKFLPVNQNYLQGIWILTNVYYDDDQLHKLFNNLDENLIQFAVLTHFEGEARILTKNNGIKSLLLNKFCLVEMEKR